MTSTMIKTIVNFVAMILAAAPVVLSHLAHLSHSSMVCETLEPVACNY